MLDADLVLIHGFWSSPATWNPLTQVLHRHWPERSADPHLRVRVSETATPALGHRHGSRTTTTSPNPYPPTSPRTPPGTGPIAIVTHSQGGLILQRFLAWMLTEGRAQELARIRVIVLLSCPNDGSEYLGTIRAATGFGHHPQASQLTVLNQKVTDTRRIVIRQIVNTSDSHGRDR